MDEKSLKYLKALKERGYSKEDAFAALDAQISKNVASTVEDKAAPEMSAGEAAAAEGIKKTAELYKSGEIGAAKAAIGVAASGARGALTDIGEKGMEGMADYVPYATPGAGKFTVNPEDPFLLKAAKMVGNIPGGAYNLAAGGINLGATAAEEAAGSRAPGSTGGAIIGGAAQLGASALEKAGEIAVVGEEKGALQAISKASETGSKLLAENPVEIASAKSEVPLEIGKFALKSAKSAPKIGSFVVGQGKKVVEGAAGKVTGASSESLRALAGNDELAARIRENGGDSPSMQEQYKMINEFKEGAEADLSEKGKLGQLYEPIRSVPVRIDQSAVEASLSEALARHGIEADPVTVSNGGKLNVAASDIGRQGKALIESALQDVRDKLFKDGRLKEDFTGMDLHNARKVLDKDYLNWDATTPAGSAESAIKGLRKAIDDLAKENIPGLKELDKQFSEASTKIDEVAREFFSKKPGGGFELKQDIVSRIKNADSPMRLSDRMDILERYVPDARQRLYVSNALRQIEQAEAKFGSAHRSIPQAIGASAGAAIAGPVGAAIGFLAGSIVTPTFMAELAIKAGYAARKLKIKLKSGNEVLAASEKISRKLAKAEKLTLEEAADAAELLRAQSKVQVREKLAEEAKKENLYRTHPAYQESPLHPDFVSNQLKKAEKLKQEAEAYKKQYPVEATKVAKEVETPSKTQKKAKSNIIKK
jgi:plasmid maintenance system antidote protein VapI